MNNAPFKIGQRVVALISIPEYLIKGNIYEVLSLDLCRTCKRWDVGFQYHHITGKLSHTCSCGTSLPIRDYYTVDSSKFAPLEENRERIRYVAVSEALREKAQETVIETCKTS